MRRPLSVIAALGALAALAFLLHGPVNAALFDPPPRTRVAAYLDATARGDEHAALAVWQPWTCCVPRPELEARRIELTRELAAVRAGQRYEIDTTEWWRTCCEPGIIDDPNNAGRARMLVTAIDASGGVHALIFDVLVRAGSWCGDACGHTRRDWTLREIHRQGSSSLRMGGPAAPLTADDAIRRVGTLARIEHGTRFELKRMTLGELKRVAGADDFTPGADPAREIWVVAAIGEVGRGISRPPSPWAVFALDVNDHLVLGIRFGDAGDRPPFFDRLPGP